MRRIGEPNQTLLHHWRLVFETSVRREKFRTETVTDRYPGIHSKNKGSTESKEYFLYPYYNHDFTLNTLLINFILTHT